MQTPRSLIATRALLLVPLVLALGATEATAQCTPQVAANTGGAGGGSFGIEIDGNYMYVNTRNNGLEVHDVTDPTNPILLYATGWAPLGSGVEAGLDYESGLVLVTRNGPLVSLYDVSTPASPVQLSMLPSSSGHDTCALAGTVAYTGDGALFQSYDISAPATPTVLGSLVTGSNSIQDMAVSGTEAYLAQRTDGLVILDVSTPATPSVLTTIATVGGDAWSVEVAGNYAYVADYTGELSIFDVSTPSTPVLVGSTAGPNPGTHNWTAVGLAGDRAYLMGNDIWAVDISNPAAPFVVGWSPTSGLDGGDRNLAADGNYAYRTSVNTSFYVYVFDMESCQPGTGELALSVADCQDDADPSAGYQIVVELDMLNLSGTDASGYAAFVSYDTAEFTYRGDLSTYEATPFSLNITPINQTNDGLLELDGSVGFMGTPTSADALLATLYFDVNTGCTPTTPIAFETGGAFISKLSLNGTAIDTTLTDPGAYTLDDTDPVFDAFSNITVAADADATNGCLGAVVTFTDPTATDNCSTPSVVSAPASGSFFPVGTTQVTTTATDDCGNVSTLMWDVTVTATNVFNIEVELAGVTGAGPVTRCIRLAGDNCSYGDFSLTFVDHDANTGTPVRAVTSVELDCGQYLSLFAKDEQHTKWSSSTVSDTGAAWATDAVIVLDGGDTDNDSDVDIDDVTLFLFQFGAGPFPSATCPWDGTRDSDFSNNGAIAAEDYVFLTSNWLTVTSGPCVLPVTGGGNGNGAANGNGVLQAELRSQTPTNKANRAADLNRDGWIDWLDVKVFERRHGLPEVLSAKMRDR